MSKPDIKWRFSPKRPSDKTRDPVAGEFFSSDAIKDAGSALVREAIQNSLDARLNRSGGKARIRIYVSGESAALRPDRHSFWFGSAWPHYSAPKNGLNPGAVTQSSLCQFLVFEDFETTGLIGSREQYEVIEGKKNPFFYFFRAEGTTEKEKESLGRWGIGKQVFPRSSKTQTFFGYSVTSEAAFLMGGCILKHHSINGKVFKPDGFFGEPKMVDDDCLTVPITDAETLARFREDFRISRQANATGLSVVVPWLDETGGDEPRVFDRNTLCLEVIEDYFVPILERRLEVELEDPNGSWKLTESNFENALAQLEASASDKRKKDIQTLRAHIKLAQDAAAKKLVSFTLGECPKEKAVWTEALLTDDSAKRMREALASDLGIEVTAALTVRPKAGEPKAATFKCYVRKKEQSNDHACHIREDLIISDVESSRVPGFVCLIRIDHGALAELLGDSENPAHTEWQKSSRNFKDKYTYGGLTIDFVANFASELVKRIHSNSKQLDKKLLIDLFSDQGPTQDPSSKRGGKNPASGGKDPKDDVPLPPLDPPRPTKPQLRVSQLVDGFTVSAGTEPLPKGSKVVVKVAYETTKGNAFTAYRPFDFRFDASKLPITVEGGTVSHSKNNELIVLADGGDFQLSVSGFDRNRDLVVKPSLRIVRDEEDASSTEEESEIAEESA